METDERKDTEIGKIEQEADEEQGKLAKKSQTGKLVFWTSTVTIYFLLYLPEFFLPSFMVMEVKLQWWYMILFFEIVYTIVSFEEQRQNEVGAKLFFGKILYETTPGLVFVPLLFCELVKESSLLLQWEVPTDLPEFYGMDKEGKPIKSLRMTTAPASAPKTTDKGKEGDPLQTGRLTLEGKILILARIDKKPGGFSQFIERMGSVDNFLKVADDLTVNTFRKEIAKKSPSEVFEEWSDVEDTARTALKKRVGSYGFSDLDVRSKEFDLPHRVNESLADRTSAHVRVETLRLEGEGQMKRDLLVAKAVKALEAAPIEGRIKALKIATKKDGMKLTSDQAIFLAYQEVIKSALEEANYTLLPQGQGGMLDPASMMSVMHEAIKVSQKANNSEEEKNTISSENNNTEGQQ